MLLAGYLLGKLITFVFCYKGARWFWAWRKRRAAASGGGDEAVVGGDVTAPLLQNAEGQVDAADQEVIVIERASDQQAVAEAEPAGPSC